MKKELLEKLKDMLGTCTDSDLMDFAEEHNLSVREVFHAASLLNAPECCHGCRHVDVFPAMYPCTECSRSHPKDMYEPE